jgi:hypothetical protein
MISDTKQKKYSLHSVLIFWSVFSVIGHLLYINTPLVNNEWVSLEGVKGILYENYREGLLCYFFNQANPIGFSICASIINIIFGFPVSYWSLRIPSLFGVILILYSFLSFTSYRRVKKGILSSIWCSLVVLSPLIWIFSGRAMPEVLALGLVCFSYILCLKAKNRNNYYILSFMVLALASLVKFHAAVIGIGIPYIIYINNDSRLSKRFFKTASLYCIILLTTLIVYFAIIYKYYNIIFVADGLKPVVQMNPMNSPRAFLDYCYYIVLLLGPISFLSPIHLWGKIRGRTYFVTIAIGILFSIITIRYGYSTFGSAEMNYGVLDSLLNRKMIIVMKAVCSSIFVFLVLDIFIEQRKGVDHFLRLLTIITITYLVVCSMGRPVQRYLIFCLPFIYYFLVFYRLNYRRLTHVIILVVTLMVFSAASISFAFYQVSQASAAENMVKWLTDANLMRKTEPGFMAVHCDHLIIPYKQNRYYEYYISMSKSGDQVFISHPKDSNPIAVHEEDINLFGFRIKTYYCIKL